MEHVVFYTGADGAAVTARFPSMGEGVSFVERLRNAEGVTDAALYALTPVPLKVTTYYRVEVPAAAVEPIGDAGAVLETGPVEPVTAVGTDEPFAAVTAGAAAEGAGRRSLGFFGH